MAPKTRIGRSLLQWRGRFARTRNCLLGVGVFALTGSQASAFTAYVSNEGGRPANKHDFTNLSDAVLDVTEPMGMETLIYFALEGRQVCGRVNPNAGARDGAPLRLAVDLNNMHLLNEGTGAVI